MFVRPLAIDFFSFVSVCVICFNHSAQLIHNNINNKKQYKMAFWQNRIIIKNTGYGERMQEWECSVDS